MVCDMVDTLPNVARFSIAIVACTSSILFKGEVCLFIFYFVILLRFLGLSVVQSLSVPHELSARHQFPTFITSFAFFY